LMISPKASAIRIDSDIALATCRLTTSEGSLVMTFSRYLASG
jgi:hypothetical protein